jgi:hypothetical protein
MLQRLANLSEKLGTGLADSRRGFLHRAALGALALLGPLAGAVLGSRGSGSGTGACYYSAGGIDYCRQLTMSQCASIQGSTWESGQPCAYAPIR